MASGLYYIFSDIRCLFLFLRKVNSKFSCGGNNSVKPQVFLVCTPETSSVTEGISVSEDNFFKKKKSCHNIQFEQKTAHFYGNNWFKYRINSDVDF